MKCAVYYFLLIFLTINHNMLARARILFQFLYYNICFCIFCNGLMMACKV